ncbi:unnamed protein product [Ilex paraguariensis]|uniref:Uncharacterized protein n=1 Tax=Ilex paraguariensis TaxID=185542 RepID=A0ABC8QWC6_9AQUA
MAVAEARAAWQRTANRCFVQEDAKRAPKLACCPSASPSSKQVDAGGASAADGQDTPTTGFLPPDKKPSYSNLSPESRWWLQIHPDYGYQRGLTNETGKVSNVCMQNEDDGGDSDDNMNAELFLDNHCRSSATCMKKDSRVRKREQKDVNTKISQDPLELPDMDESFVLMEMDSVGCSVSKQPDVFSMDPDCTWIGGAKTEPWWRTADRDELALLVAQRSFDLIENCDLPQPQNTSVKRDPYAHFWCSDSKETFSSPICGKLQSGGHPNQTVHTWGNLCSWSAYGKPLASVEGHSQSGTERPISECTADKAVTETQMSESDPSRAQLLEALRHSQTRAREAENAATKAYAEKEHVVKLFFRQASYLFAYKQWFQLLRLENLYFQIKNNRSQPISTIFPVVLPWMPLKTRKMRRSWQKAAKGRRAQCDRPRCDISKYAIVFALGLGIVGAGLLLGWTVGWMLPII